MDGNVPPVLVKRQTVPLTVQAREPFPQARFFVAFSRHGRFLRLWRMAGGGIAMRRRAQRPLRSLPFAFWFGWNSRASTEHDRTSLKTMATFIGAIKQWILLAASRL